MARVLLLSATPAGEHTRDNIAPLSGLRGSAEVDRFREHSLTADPAEADLILFAEAYGAGWHFEHVRRHPFTRAYREKCFLFCTNPFVIPFLPGIYTAIDRRWDSARTVSGFYIGLPPNPFITYSPPTDDLPYLYSFVGSPGNASVRAQIAQLEHPRGYLRDTSEDFARALRGAMPEAEKRKYQERYAEKTRSSKFVLCPRGLSVSTIRLFETMQMGRVPVILSDGWVEPPGPAWSEFAIRIPERDAATLPRLLEAREHEAVAMGETARREWLDWFSPEVAFHRAVEACLQVRERRRVPERFARWSAYVQYLRPFHGRRMLRRQLTRMRSAVAHRL